MTRDETRRALVLGASGGLGYASAAALLERGWRVTIAARAGERLAAAERSLSALGDVTSQPVDLTSDSLALELQRFLADCGTLDAVVLSGGGPAPSVALKIEDATLDAAYRLVLRPAVAVVREVGSFMAAQNHGALVMITSSGVREPIPNLAPSNIMRAGVTALMKTAARELGPHNVRINCVAPGRIATERVAVLDQAAATRAGITVHQARATSIATIPMGRYGEPHEFGRVVAWLCSEEATYVTGTTVQADGGKSWGILT